MADIMTSGVTAAEHMAGIYGRERNRVSGGISAEKQNVEKTEANRNIDGQMGMSFREYIEDALEKGTAVLTGNNIICIIPAGNLSAGLSGYGLSGGLSSAGLLSSGMGFMSPGLLSSGLSSAGLLLSGLPLWNAGSPAKSYGINVSSGNSAAAGYSGRSTNRAGRINAYKNTLKSAKGRLSERR